MMNRAGALYVNAQAKSTSCSHRAMLVATRTISWHHFKMRKFASGMRIRSLSSLAKALYSMAIARAATMRRNDAACYQ